MTTPIEQPDDDATAKRDRRKKLLIGSAVAVGTTAAGILLWKSNAQLPLGAVAKAAKGQAKAAAVVAKDQVVALGESEVGSRAAAAAHTVGRHTKEQAYGPGWALRRTIEVGPYPRGVSTAA